MMRTRLFVAIPFLVLALGGCMMNWWHPFTSDYTRSTRKAVADAGSAVIIDGPYLVATPAVKRP